MAAPGGGRLKKILSLLGPLLGLAIVLGIFTGINGLGYLDPSNIQTMLADATIVAIAALGMTLVIIGGGIDLSVGSVVALSSVLCARALYAIDPAGADPLTLKFWLVAFAVGIGAGAICGLVNGVAIIGLRVAPFIATLGMLSIARGAAKWVANNQPINVNYEFGNWTDPFVESGFFSPVVWMSLVLAIVVAFVLHRTIYGRNTVALGCSEETSWLCGIRINWLKVSLYMLAGALAGLAGVVQTSRLTQGDPTVAQGLELNVIAAVVIGGGSLSGGEGSVLGTLAGALIMSALAFGATQAGWDNYVQEILIGMIIVFAVALDQLRSKRKA